MHAMYMHMHIPLWHMDMYSIIFPIAGGVMHHATIEGLVLSHTWKDQFA